MSTNNYILNLLNIKDENIHIITECKEKMIKRKNYKIIEGILTYTPEYCPCCGVANQSTNDIIKWGFRKNCIVKIPKQGNCLTRLILHKQRFFCKHCNNTFIAETNLVDRNKNISNNTNHQIRLELMEKQSEKDIAKRMDVSVSVIDRILNEISSHTVLRHPTLPKSMNWDEFKATKDTKGKMAFIITDNVNGNLFDITGSRKSRDLEKYFRRYSKQERDKVKHISIDFYSGYIYLAKKLFKNADISIDRFHIISEEKHYSKHFHKEISQKEFVQYLINTDLTLKTNYECYQGLINSLKEKNFNKFKAIIFNQNKNLSPKMKQALKLYRENIKYIENSFKYDINNGIIEGINNLIKCIKRIAFGYRKFDHFISRIFLIKGIIKG